MVITLDKVSKVDSLKKKRDILNARIQLIQNREQSKIRKGETRKKILIGAYYLEQAEKKNSFDDLLKLMDTYLIRGSDRKLFNLPVIKE